MPENDFFSKDFSQDESHDRFLEAYRASMADMHEDKRSAHKDAWLEQQKHDQRQQVGKVRQELNAQVGFDTNVQRQAFIEQQETRIREIVDEGKTLDSEYEQLEKRIGEKRSEINKREDERDIHIKTLQALNTSPDQIGQDRQNLTSKILELQAEANALEDQLKSIADRRTRLQNEAEAYRNLITAQGQFSKKINQDQNAVRGLYKAEQRNLSRVETIDAELTQLKNEQVQLQAEEAKLLNALAEPSADWNAQAQVENIANVRTKLGNITAQIEELDRELRTSPYIENLQQQAEARIKAEAERANKEYASSELEATPTPVPEAIMPETDQDGKTQDTKDDEERGKRLFEKLAAEEPPPISDESTKESKITKLTTPHEGNFVAPPENNYTPIETLEFQSQQILYAFANREAKISYVFRRLSQMNTNPLGRVPTVDGGVADGGVVPRHLILSGLLFGDSIKDFDPNTDRVLTNLEVQTLHSAVVSGDIFPNESFREFARRILGLSDDELSQDSGNDIPEAHEDINIPVRSIRNNTDEPSLLQQFRDKVEEWSDEIESQAQSVGSWFRNLFGQSNNEPRLTRMEPAIDPDGDDDEPYLYNQQHFEDMTEEMDATWWDSDQIISTFNILESIHDYLSEREIFSPPLKIVDPLGNTVEIGSMPDFYYLLNTVRQHALDTAKGMTDIYRSIFDVVLTELYGHSLLGYQVAPGRYADDDSVPAFYPKWDAADTNAQANVDKDGMDAPAFLRRKPSTSTTPEQPDYMGVARNLEDPNNDLVDAMMANEPGHTIFSPPSRTDLEELRERPPFTLPPESPIAGRRSIYPPQAENQREEIKTAETEIAQSLRDIMNQYPVGFDPRYISTEVTIAGGRKGLITSEVGFYNYVSSPEVATVLQMEEFASFRERLSEVTARYSIDLLTKEIYLSELLTDDSTLPLLTLDVRDLQGNAVRLANWQGVLSFFNTTEMREAAVRLDNKTPFVNDENKPSSKLRKIIETAEAQLNTPQS